MAPGGGVATLRSKSSGCSEEDQSGPCEEEESTDLEIGESRGGGYSISSSDGAVAASEEGERAAGVVEILEVSHDWAGLGGSSSGGSFDRAASPRDPMKRYPRFAPEDRAAESETTPHLNSLFSMLQPLSGVVIFCAVNLRIAASSFDLLSNCCGPCSHKVVGMDGLYLFMDFVFVVFQYVCVRRDRAMMEVRQRLWSQGSYVSLLLYHGYLFLFLSCLSFWQILRSIRQWRNPAYRDSFLVELHDPGMIDHSIMRMPFFSSLLTFLFELPFTLRMVFCFTRALPLFASAWLVNFQLVVVAAVNLDYSLSRSVRMKYATGQVCKVGLVHYIYRYAECMATMLMVGVLTLECMQQHWRLTVPFAIGYLALTLAALCHAEGGCWKRALPLSLPFCFLNLALFVDEPGVARGARLLTKICDAMHVIGLVLASLAYHWQLQLYWAGSCSDGNFFFGVRLHGSLATMLLCSLTCLLLRKCSMVTVPEAEAQQPKHGTSETGGLESGNAPHRMLHEQTDRVFGSNLDGSLHRRFESSQGLVSLIFSTAIGDQFASLLEIFWEGKGELRLSRFQTLGKLGEGGFGRVFRVHDTRTGTHYALKLQRKDRKSRTAVREALALRVSDPVGPASGVSGFIAHGFIVEIEHIFHTTDFYGILMELCDQDLNRRILERRGADGRIEGLPVEQVQHYLACMLLALEHLHSRDMIFCDLKPENVLTTTGDGGGATLATRSHAKLADFGLARRMLPPAVRRDINSTKAGGGCGITVGIGTPAFMPPEAFQQDSSSCTPCWAARRDWYGLGCCFVLMLLGERVGRVVQSGQRAVLLLMASEELQSFLCAAAEDPSNIAEALSLASLLTLDDADQRAGSAEMRRSPFLQGIIPELELLATQLSPGKVEYPATV